MISDTACAAELAASSWETMQAQAEVSHQEALREAGEALAAFLCADLVARVRPSYDADVEVICADVRVMRAERRLGR